MSSELSRKILNKLIVTEKTSLSPDQYVFYVKYDANKLSIKKAVEQIFQVKVQSVRTLIEKKPVRLTRRGSVRLAKQKKAYIKLYPDNILEVEDLDTI